MQKRTAGLLIVGAAALGLNFLLAQPILTAPGLPLFRDNFTEVAPQGFGDRQNTQAWSMQWWRGKLYVGTRRSGLCFKAWSLNCSAYPVLHEYPPRDPEVECTENPHDLPLQAEIWRYTPETETWQRVYQSPNEVEVPDDPGKYMAYDVGFRGMTVFTEAGGTEVLYAVGTTIRACNKAAPPPRILRSTDGETWEPVPQDPGTFLDLPLTLNGIDINSMRTPVGYNGRLYVNAGRLRGEGLLLEAENPAGGNDNFRLVSPPGMLVFEMVPFNGYLYLGLNDPDNGYSVVKTDATGTPPYTFIPVVTDGGFLPRLPSKIVLSMHVFKGRLYVGTDKPAELIRINPDDTWDLLVGAPRETPDGMKTPLSGMGAGFDYLLNEHMWRMGDYDGWLYVGTNDASTFWKEVPVVSSVLRPHMGFDLFTTPDGWHFTMITRTGFDSIYDYGIRTFASTPYGIFFGTANPWYGLRIYQGVPGEVHTVYLPILQVSAGRTAVTQESGTTPSVVQGPSRSARLLEPPERLEVESNGAAVLLSWERPRGATRFRIFRSDFISNRALQIPDLHPDAWIPTKFTEVGTTDQFFFVDTTAHTARRYYYYYMLAENATGAVSHPSNLVRASSLAPTVTFDGLKNTIAQWTGRAKVMKSQNEEGMEGLFSILTDAHDDVEARDLGRALDRLEQLRRRAKRNQLPMLDPWRAEDLEILLSKLMRRVRLAQAGIISPSDLNSSMPQTKEIPWTQNSISCLSP